LRFSAASSPRHWFPSPTSAPVLYPIKNFGSYKNLIRPEVRCYDLVSSLWISIFEDQPRKYCSTATGVRYLFPDRVAGTKIQSHDLPSSIISLNKILFISFIDKSSSFKSVKLNISFALKYVLNFSFHYYFAFISFSLEKSILTSLKGLIYLPFDFMIINICVPLNTLTGIGQYNFSMSSQMTFISIHHH
jgi:hypothetical protein